jgi:uncharacterized protein
VRPPVDIQTACVGRPIATTPGVLIHIMVKSVEQTLEAVVEQGGTIVQAIGADLPEITAHFADPAGNVFGLYQHKGL